MMELSDKVKCDASSFEVEWRASEPGWAVTIAARSEASGRTRAGSMCCCAP